MAGIEAVAHGGVVLIDAITVPDSKVGAACPGTDALATCYSPEQAQEVYSGLLNQSLPTLAAIFDWRSK